VTREWVRESFETGGTMPLLPAQRAVGCARIIEDETGTIESETLVLPNLVVYFTERVGNAWLGQSLMTKPSNAQEFIEGALTERCEGVTECDCEWHDGHSMVMIDPEEV